MYNSLIRCIMLGFSIKFKGRVALNSIILGNSNTANIFKPLNLSRSNGQKRLILMLIF